MFKSVTRLFGRINQYYQWLLEPQPQLQDADKASKIRLLANIIIILAFLTLVIILPINLALFNFLTYAKDNYIWLSLIILGIFLIAFILNRRGSNGLAALLVLGITILSLLFIVVNASAIFHLYALHYLIVPIFLSSILFPLQITVALMLVSLISTAIITPLLNQAIFGDYIIDQFTFLIVVSSLIILSTYYRNRLEQAHKTELAEKEARYRTLLETIFEGILYHERQTIIEANPGFASMFGYTPDEIMGKDLRDFFHKSSHPTIVHNQQFTVTPPYEVSGVRKDGSLFDIEILARTEVHQGRTVRVVALRDISDRKAAEKAAVIAKLELERRVIERTAELESANTKLREEIAERERIEAALKLSEEHFRVLFENAPIAFYQSTPEGKLLMVNQACANMLGYRSPADMLKLNIAKDLFYHPEERRFNTATLERQGFVQNTELTLRHASGQAITVLENARLVHNSANNSYYYEGTLVNITERKQVEEDILRALEREKELNELKYQFITMASHQFRTPLSIVLSSAELLEYYGQNWSEEKRKQHLTNIQAAVLHLTELLDNFSSIGGDDPEMLKFIAAQAR